MSIVMFQFVLQIVELKSLQSYNGPLKGLNLQRD